MSIDLDQETEKLVQQEIAAGRFADASSLLSVAVKHFLIAREFGEEEARKLAVLRAELDHADEQIERGEYKEYDEHTIKDFAKEVHERGLRRLATLQKTGTK